MKKVFKNQKSTLFYVVTDEKIVKYSFQDRSFSSKDVKKLPNKLIQSNREELHNKLQLAIAF